LNSIRTPQEKELQVPEKETAHAEPS